MSNGQKVLFINPPYRRYPPFNYLIADVPANLTLLAAILLEKGWDVEAFDMPILKKRLEDAIEAIGNAKPDIIGISSRTSYIFPIVSTLAELIKQHYPDIPIVVGGHYVTYKPEEALRAAPAIDYICVGDSDLNIHDIYESVLNKDHEKLKKIKGVAFREGDNIINTGPGCAIENLDDLPLPAVHLWPLDEYVRQGRRYITFISKGCPFNCKFCGTWSTKQKIRYRSPERIIKEMKTAYDAGFRYFYFFDDLFTINKELVYKLCDLIHENNMEIKWSCLSHVKMVDEDILKKMAEAGCDIVAYGVESGSERVLDSVGKSEQFSYVKNAFRMTQNAGIRAQSFIMFGLPEARFEDEVKTFNFINDELKPDDVGVFSFTPYPGTQHYDHPETQGMRLLIPDLNRLSLVDAPVHDTNYLTREELIKFQVMANYMWRSKNRVPKGLKPRRRRDVAVIRTPEGGLVYNPYQPEEKRTTDMYLSTIKVDEITFDILYFFDGFHSTDRIATKIGKLYDLPYDKALERVNVVVDYFTNKVELLELNEW